ADSRAGLPGGVPRHDRHHDRERRASLDPRAHPLRGAEPAVGRQRLLAHLRRFPAAPWSRRRPARAPPTVRRRHAVVRRLIARVWLAGDEGVLIGARLAQGLGAAMMTPAALSILTTTFVEGKDRTKAIGLWSATIPLGAVIG